MNKLERLINSELNPLFDSLGVENENQVKLVNYLKRIGQKDSNKLLHSMRVGSLGISVANNLKINPNKLFYPGLLHDSGIIRISDDVIKRSNEYKAFSLEDMEIMKSHPLYSYEILKEDYRFSAMISLLHHRYQKDKYPNEEDFPLEYNELSPGTKAEVEDISRYISVIDCYDAAKNRDNGRF